ncbi:MAG: efflux RND transporter periplasmic adaptor subunit [Gammaproteobacteria bacterium]|nr:efflux RND transporter periplasmic adaptor subunit [Gammaproteobacteria bacterium]
MRPSSRRPRDAWRMRNPMTPWSSRFLASLLALSFFLTACGGDDPSARQGRRSGPIPVVAEPVTLEAERLRLEAVGTSQARRSVELFAETTGDVARVSFSPGDLVEEGEILVALEAEDEQLALALAEVQVADAEQLLERYRRANERGERTVPETTVDATKTALAAALIARDRASVALEKRRVRAPFAGYVGFSDLDPGDRVDLSTAVTTLDDRATLLINFEVPEAYLGAIAVGEGITVESWTARPLRAEGTIVDLGARVDPLTRAFLARAEVANREDALRPGMSFRVSLNLTGARWPAVPELSLQWGADRRHHRSAPGGADSGEGRPHPRRSHRHGRGPVHAPRRGREAPRRRSPGQQCSRSAEGRGLGHE